MKELYVRALALFDEYVELPMPQQAQRLAALADTDPELHAILRALLDIDLRPGELFVDRSPMELIERARPLSDRDGPPPDQDSRIGARAGAWRIERLIASGGMGAVYEAHRDDGEYRQRVALKFVRAELATPQLQAAFRQERQLLAQLDHPGIAGLVDGGIDADGHPWFAMRYVQGAPVDAWSDARRLDVRARVELLVQAGHALAYAHAQGVVHGDIKPSNLLVEHGGRVQLVDFGISSLAGSVEQAIAITRDFAAPEQRALGVRAASTDIYAFGVLMYRLLCGQWPTPRHALQGALPLAQVEAAPMEALAKEVPAQVAQQRGANSGAALARLLSGDLSAIARKAAASQPGERYASVAALVDDLQRWLQRRPVSARPLAWPARAGRWLDRHRIASATVVALLTALLLSAGFAYRQQQRNLDEARASDSISQLFASNLGAATLSGLGTTPISSQALLEKTERELRHLPLADQPALFARGLATLARNRAAIGDIRDANRLAEEASRALGDSDDATGSVETTRVAMLNLQGRHVQAETLARSTLSRLDACMVGQRYCPRIDLRAELARAQWGMAQPQLAVRTIGAAVAEAEALNHRELTAELLTLRGNFNANLMRLPQAEADDRRAIALADRVNPVLADDARTQLSGILNQRQAPEAVRFARQLLANRTRTLGARHPKTAWAWIYLGMIQSPPESFASIGRGMAIIESVYGRDHPEYAAGVVQTGWIAPGMERARIVQIERAVQVLNDRTGPRSQRTMAARSSLGYMLLDMPGALRTPADTERGLALLAGVIRDRDAIGLPAPRERLMLARGLITFGPAERLPEAARLLDQSALDAQRYFSAGDTYPMMVTVFRGKLLYRMDQHRLADEVFAAWIEQNRAYIEQTHAKASDANALIHAVTLYVSMLYRSLYAYEACHRDSAMAHAASAKALAEHAFGATDYRVDLTRDVMDAIRRHTAVNIPLNSGLVPVPDQIVSNARAVACESR